MYQVCAVCEKTISEVEFQAKIRVYPKGLWPRTTGYAYLHYCEKCWNKKIKQKLHLLNAVYSVWEDFDIPDIEAPLIKARQ